MPRSVFCKLIQRQTYDILSHRQSVVWCFVGFVLLTVSVLHFGETVLTWSKEKYNVVFNSYSDNVAGKSFEHRLCEQVPIDVVYTWVNGTDPKVISALAELKQEFSAQQVNQSSNGTCTYLHCVPTHMVLVWPVLSPSITLSDLNAANPLLSSVTKVLSVSGPIAGKKTNMTIFVFNSREEAANVARKKIITIGEQNYTLRIAYITDDWLAQNTVPLATAAFLTLVPAGHSEEELFKMLPRSAQVLIEKVFLYEDKSLAVLTVRNKAALDALMHHDNFTLNNKVSKLATASLILKLVQEEGDISSNRFADNEELRYSLRSLEKHAPWVRHVYIVTNGQIPHWLNLDNPRVSIITHEEIFANKSHLPTFSSPAIESHLHKIPNLSKKFLYLNDDVIFGKDVWPDDFYTHAKGQKIYLTWPVPDCSEGCPSSWIRDGYCDKACNNSECQWDGGDCQNGHSLPDGGFAGIGSPNAGASRGDLLTNLDRTYCNPSCANTWLADKYCDQACNVKRCAFDAGDCGTNHYDQLYQLKLDQEKTEYELPQGETLAYFNLTTFMVENTTITEGQYEEVNMVRTVSISLKYKVLTCILHPGFNKSTIVMTLKGKKDNNDFKFTFKLRVNTLPVTSKPVNASAEIKKEHQAAQINATESAVEAITFEEFAEDQKKPKIQDAGHKVSLVPDFSRLNLSGIHFPPETETKMATLKQQLENGELTAKGFLKKQALLLQNYFKDSPQNLSMIPTLATLNTSQSPSVRNISSDLGSEKKLKTLLQNYSSAPIGKRLLSMLSKVDDSNWAPTTIKNLTLPGQPMELNQILHIPQSTTLSQEEMYRLIREKYESPPKKLRHLMDAFGDSLRHVNKLYNEAFGYVPRKVPAHVAHLIDIDVMNRLHERFPNEFDVTSSHKIRSPDDMQFAFSYYYFLMSEKVNVSLSGIFDRFDTDISSTWSDREIRSVIVQLNDLPLDYNSIKDFEDQIINCSQHFPQEIKDIPTPPFERYYNSSLPLVTKDLILACSPITTMLEKKFSTRNKNSFEIMGEEEVAFKMIHTNLSQVIGQIDDLRKHPKKFICLNDNINHSSKEADMIRAVLQDYYESLFPIRSQFELPPEYRNKFLYIEDLKEWRKNRDRIRYATYTCLGILITITLALFYSSEVKPLLKDRPSTRRHSQRRRLKPHPATLDV